MRIISGIHKGRRISIPKNFKSRPTTDFAKENLFNVLSNSLYFEDINVLDLFSGTGSIAFEFASRGAKEVTAVEKDYHHMLFIKKNAEALKLDNFNVIKSNAFVFIKRIDKKYDLIFADPPFELKEIEKIPGLIWESGILNSGGRFILEHSANYNFSNSDNFVELRKYGGVNFSIFKKAF